MATHTTCFHVLVSCLEQAQRTGQAEGPYRAVNEAQATFLEAYYESGTGDLPHFGEGQLVGVAAWTAEEINSFLAARGFQITLSPFTDPDTFGVAAIMNVRVEWEYPGEVTYGYRVGGDTGFPDIKMVKMENVLSYNRSADGTVIANLPTKDPNVVVHLCIAEEELEGEALLKRVLTLMGERTPEYGYGDVQFPMVSLDQEVDVSWLEGIGFPGVGRTGRHGLYSVAEAKQQTRFRMNEIGATAESAAAMQVLLECYRPPKPVYLINRPFYVWITHTNMALPIFAGYIDQDAWREPQGL